MKLIDNPLSPYSMKIRMILNEKGIDYDNQEIHTEDDRDALLAANPRAEVPALVDGDNTIADSKVIAEYIEERHPEPALLPKDLGLRARCRNLELLADNELDAAVVVFFLFKFFRPEVAEQRPKELENSLQSIRDLYQRIDGELGGREYFLGDFSRADLAFAPHFGALAFFDVLPGDELPGLAAWWGRVSARPSVQKVMEQATASVGVTHDKPLFDPQHLHWRNDRIEQLIRVGLGDWLLEELAAGRGFLPGGE